MSEVEKCTQHLCSYLPAAQRRDAVNTRSDVRLVAECRRQLKVTLDETRLCEVKWML